jgi:dimethylhistidine N-methyltransferase
MSLSAQKWFDENEVDEEFLTDVIDGLSKPQKTLPCKYFYDEKGSILFEQICKTPEYYVTRTECSIYAKYAAEMASLIGERALIIEPGAGSIKKISLLLETMKNPAGFIPMDISEEILQLSSDALSQQFPDLDITPIVIDFLNKEELHQLFAKLPSQPLVNKRIIFFPGSTIGNFHPEEAKQFLKQFADNLQSGDGLLIGVDLVKDHKILENAYNDAEGVTADFNLNLLHRINNELGGNVTVNAFEHKAIFNEEDSRIEMHIVSTQAQKIQLPNQSFSFDKNETIHTENSYKYSVEMFSEIARESGFSLEKVWKDSNSLFSVSYYTVI